MSKRRRFDPDLLDQPLEIKNVLPLLDVMFALLTFFIMSTLFLTRTEGLPVNLPQAKSATEQKTASRATLTVTERNEVFLNKQKIGIEDVGDRVQQLVEPNQNLVVVLNADQKVEHGEVVLIMDQLRQIPGVKMAISTKRI